MLVSSPRRLSEKPSAFRRRSAPASRGRPLAATSRSAMTMRSSSRRNQGSNLVVSWMSSTVRPARRAWPATSRRSGVGEDRAARKASGPPSPGGSMASRPDSPVSMLRKPFLQGFGEGTADRHRLAHGFHRRGQQRRRAGKFLEGEAGDLHHDVVDRRLETGRRDHGDVVGQLIQRVADGQLGGDLGDRETGGLRCQRRGAGDARDSSR